MNIERNSLYLRIETRTWLKKKKRKHIRNVMKWNQKSSEYVGHHFLRRFSPYCAGDSARPYKNNNPSLYVLKNNWNYHNIVWTTRTRNFSRRTFPPNKSQRLQNTYTFDKGTEGQTRIRETFHDRLIKKFYRSARSLQRFMSLLCVLSINPAGTPSFFRLDNFSPKYWKTLDIFFSAYFIYIFPS